MLKLSDSISRVLSDLGLGQERVVLIHSGVSTIARGLGVGGHNAHENVEALHVGLTNVLGKTGTITAPGYFYNYARYDQPYIVEESLPDVALGRYPRFLFAQDGVKRSLNPITNLLALGPNAEIICSHQSAFGHGITSPWSRLLQLDACCLFFGAPFSSMTFVYHMEVMVGVPHRYNKIYRTPVIVGKREIELPIVAAMRYLNYNVNYSFDRLEELLIQRGLLRSFQQGNLSAKLVKLRDVETILVEFLSRDPYFLLVEAPTFVQGEIPSDGSTGPKRS